MIVDFFNIRYDQIGKNEHGLLYEISIKGEKKIVEFRGENGIYASSKLVYVQITDGPHTNKFRQAHLRLFEYKNKLLLCPVYTVLNQFAFIESWIDSEQGKRHRLNEASDVIPIPDVEEAKGNEIILRLLNAFE